MTNHIFIPKKIKVGYDKREDTYTKKLAYVIYYDEKGKLRKEASWENWRDKDIPFDDFDNEPTEGFVLNKNVGGYAYHWDARKAYIRIFDPRGFEFEITLPNLLYILENTSSIKGKGLEGQFVYGWEGKELVLIPVNAPEYVKMQEMTKTLFEGEFVKPAELKVGYTYLTPKDERYVFMGRVPQYKYDYLHYNYEHLEDEFKKAIRENPDYKRDRSEYYITYKKAVEKPKRYYFFNLATKCFESWVGVSKKFYTMEGKTPHKDYHIFEDWFTSMSEICPEDYDHLEFEVVSKEEFAETLKKELRLEEPTVYTTNHSYYSFEDDRVVHVETYYKDGILTYYVEKDVPRHYSWNHRFLAQTKQETTVEELYKKYPKVNIKRFLTNGKVKNNTWWKYEYEE